MSMYPKMQTVFKRDPETKYKTLLEGEFSIPEFEYLQNNKWIFTEKVDGTNIRVCFEQEKVFYRGRTDKAQIPAQLYEVLDELFSHQADKFNGMCLYGEGYGGRIQKGDKYSEEHNFVLFDAYCNGIWLERPAVVGIAKELGIDVVPIIGEGTLKTMVETARRGITSTWGEFTAEGIVARPATELLTRRGDRIITKIKCKDFIKP